MIGIIILNAIHNKYPIAKLFLTKNLCLVFKFLETDISDYITGLAVFRPMFYSLIYCQTHLIIVLINFYICSIKEYLSCWIASQLLLGKIEIQKIMKEVLEISLFIYFFIFFFLLFSFFFSLFFISSFSASWSEIILYCANISIDLFLKCSWRGSLSFSHFSLS